jgi:anti-sigma B factor antagonist
MAFSMHVDDSSGAPLLVAKGRIVGNNSEAFGGKLQSMVNMVTGDVEVDLSKVDFIDSFGLGMLVRTYNSLQKNDRSLRIIYKNPDSEAYLRRLFDTTGLNRILTIVRGRD